MHSKVFFVVVVVVVFLIKQKKGKAEEERNLVIFKDIHINSHINGELSIRPFH